jgi:hypothetical protein
LAFVEVLHPRPPGACGHLPQLGVRGQEGGRLVHRQLGPRQARDLLQVAPAPVVDHVVHLQPADRVPGEDLDETRVARVVRRARDVRRGKAGPRSRSSKAFIDARCSSSLWGVERELTKEQVRLDQHHQRPGAASRCSVNSWCGKTMRAVGMPGWVPD